MIKILVLSIALSFAVVSNLSAQPTSKKQVVLPSKPIYGIDELYVFPWYGSQSDYFKRTGKKAPWNPALAPKNWEDPAANDTAFTKRSVVYTNTLVTDATGRVLVDSKGVPQLDLLVLPKAIAGSVNIPPDGANVEGADQLPIPAPLRDLDPDEEFTTNGAFGGLAVKNNRYLSTHEDELSTSFQNSDRSRMVRIEKMLSDLTKLLAK